MSSPPTSIRTVAGRPLPPIVTAAPLSPAQFVDWSWRSLAIALGYFGLGSLGLQLADGLPLVSPFWPAAGLALAVLLRGNLWLAPAVALGAWGVNLSAGAAPALAAAIALGNTGGPWLAAHWLQRSGFDNRLERPRDLLLLTVAALGGSTLSAANGTAWLSIAGRVSVLDLPHTAMLWWLGDSLGVMLAGVPLIALGRREISACLAPGRRLATLGLLGLSLAATLAALAAPSEALPTALVLTLLPPVLLCGLALYSGIAPASAGVLVLTVLTLGGTALGWGPFARDDSGLAIPLVWAHTALMAALVLLAHLRVGGLVRREARWKLALQGSGLAVAEWNLRTGAGYLSSRWRQLADEGDAEPDSSLEHWLGQVHGEDREALRAALRAPGSDAAPVSRSELRMRQGERWAWFELQLTVADRDRQGRPLRVVASLADVGVQREVQEQLRLSASVLMHLNEGLLVTDADLRVIDANPAFSRITGIAREELVGTVPDLLRPIADDLPSRQQRAQLWTALRDADHWSGELQARRRNGEPCTLQITVSKAHRPDGALSHHVVVVSDVTEQRLQRERMERQAHFDELTHLPNRARLGQLMAEAMAATDRDGYLLAVCYLDLDHFKAANARHGHAAGDRLLAEVADRLRSALRSRGSVWSDTAARLGGDEFVLLLRAGTVDEARSAVERVLRVVSQPLAVAPDQPPEQITASVGATVYPLDASDADTLLRHADQAMYGVKQSGRNGYLFFDPEHSRRNEERVLAIGRVQDALDHDELLLYYQPKVDLKRGVVLGFEALLRWNHPEHGVVPPAQFLPLIEHTGLSARVGDHVLARALDQLEVWLQQGLDLSVSVNISARHLQEPDFAQRLAELLARHPQPLGPRLELEVLETAALTDISFTSALLDRCAQLGVRWALDDFGTGYSTLTYLKRLPVQVLKIDRSFVQNMLTDAQDRAIVEGVIGLARTFGCVAVAEGLETPAQSRMLLEMGCEVGQGQGIAAPMPAAEVGPWVREWRGLFALAEAPANAVAGSGAAGTGRTTRGIGQF